MACHHHHHTKRCEGEVEEPTYEETCVSPTPTRQADCSEGERLPFSPCSAHRAGVEAHVRSPLPVRKTEYLVSGVGSGATASVTATTFAAPLPCLPLWECISSRMTLETLALARRDIAKLLQFTLRKLHKSPHVTASIVAHAEAMFDVVWTLDPHHLFASHGARWIGREWCIAIESGVAAACVQVVLMHHLHTLLPWAQLSRALAVHAHSAQGDNPSVLAAVVEVEAQHLTHAVANALLPSLLRSTTNNVCTL